VTDPDRDWRLAELELSVARERPPGQCKDPNRAGVTVKGGIGGPDRDAIMRAAEAGARVLCYPFCKDLRETRGTPDLTSFQLLPCPTAVQTRFREVQAPEGFVTCQGSWTWPSMRFMTRSPRAKTA
jgi:hypothetical protein